MPYNHAFHVSAADLERQTRFTRHFAECERALQGFAFSLVPNRADADDLVQETLKALWEKFDEYDPNRPFLPWANRFLYRQVLMHRRKQAIRSKYVFSEQAIEALADSEHASLDQERARINALERCLATLPQSQRALIEQRYLVKGTLQELAREMGNSANSLYKKLQRIREALYGCIRKRMAKEELST